MWQKKMSKKIYPKNTCKIEKHETSTIKKKTREKLCQIKFNSSIKQRSKTIPINLVKS
jgi:hypothetical protein